MPSEPYRTREERRGLRITDRKRHVMDSFTLESMSFNARAGCLLCGHWFKPGDGFRWVYANFKSSPFKHGNFLVCDACDKGDDENRRIASKLWDSVNPVMQARMRGQYGD